MSGGRFFSDSERAALYLAADGKCSLCGVDLEPGWHADHVTPSSRGGDTDVVNGQALCPVCNLKKGADMSELRKWQQRALAELARWKRTGDTGFLVEATPGAGKTRFAIAATARLVEAGTIDRVVIAVPTARLEYQWHEEFAKFGFHINPDWHASVGVLPADEHGCAATYAEIARQPAVFRKLVSQRRTLAILDEVHHCAADRSWGDGIGEAFGPAVLKLMLSGTPFRSDNNEIPFVNYVDGTGVPDYRYGYGEALDDEVVRPVWFPRRGGMTEWAYGTSTHSHSFDDELDKTDANRRLRTAISPTGQWLPSVLGDADGQLTELRETDPTAGGIVFCENSDAARAVSRLLEEMGRDVTLAISDEAQSQERIVEFRESRAPWLVSIRQVSEGVDIPRLRVGVYATNFLTEMFFRQVIGRMVRRRPDEEDSTAYLFIPDDKRLRDMAQTIREARDHVLNRQLDEQTGSGDEHAEGTLFDPSLFTPVASMAEDRGMIVDTDTVTPDQLAEAERVKQLEADTAVMPTALVAKLLISSGYFDTKKPTASSPASTPETSKADRKKQLQNANNQAARRISYANATEFSHVNAGLNRAVGVGKLRQCTEEQLQRRLDIAQQWLSTGSPPGAS